MQFKKTGKHADPLNKAVGQVHTYIENNGSEIATNAQTNALVSLESIDHATYVSLESHMSSIESQIGATLRGIQTADALEIFDDSTPRGKRRLEVAMEAAAMAAVAVGDLSSFARKAATAQASASQGVRMGDISGSGSLDYRDNASMEAFDNRELKEFLPFSIIWNAYASRQDEFAEAFFPTTVAPPDQGGIDVSVTRMLVFNEVKRAASGAAADFDKKNLIDAAVDYTILADESTTVVPVRATDNSNAADFVPSASVAPTSLLIGKVAVPTAPLLMGKKLDILGLSTYAPLIGAGILDNTDALDNAIGLKKIYLSPASGDPAVAFSVESLPRSRFVKTPEGNYREMGLQFRTDDLVIDETTTAVDGSTVDGFAAIATNHWKVFLSVSVTGEANTEIGNVKVWASPVTVSAIIDADGNNIDTASGAGKTLADAIAAMPFIGYDLSAKRTNSNRRTRGKLLDSTIEVERYPIPLGAPLSIPTPVTVSEDASKLKVLITAANQRNTNNAITALFNIADELKAYVSGVQRPGVVPQVGGMGRFLVKPFYEEHDLDMLKAVNSLKSYERAADVAMAVVNAIRDLAYRMYRDSRYQAALNGLAAGGAEKPKLIIGCDQVMARHLMVAGDTRTFGTAFDSFEVVSSLDARMTDTIFLTFVRPGQSGPDPLSFGTHGWIPQLASTVDVNRNGATIKEPMVQPRTVHFNNLPVLGKINVSHLSDVLGDRTSWPAAGDAVTDGWLGTP